MALIEVNWKPGRRDLRIFALLFLIFSAGVGTLFYFKDYPRLVSQILWIAGPIVALFGLLLPRVILPLYVVMTVIALPIGMVISTILLLVIYYLIMTPIGWAMRLAGHDPLGRRPDDSASSYWIPRPTEDEAEHAKRYFRQY